MPPYAPGTFGAEAGGRSLRILESYIEARRQTEQGQELMLGQEAMSTSDFPTFIGSILRYRFIERFTEVSGAWNQWTAPVSLRDFETYTSSRLGRFADMPQKPLNAEYEQLAIRELPGPELKLIEWGFGFALTRQLVITDREDRLRDLPNLAAESAARTISKRAAAVLEANGTAYDGTALFHTNHANKGTTALTADIGGVNALKAAFDAIDLQTDPEGYKIVQPTSRYILLIPRTLRWIAEALRDRETLPLDVTSGTSLLRANEVAGRFSIVEDWYLTDTNNWYVLVEPQDVRYAPIVGMTLNGETTPFIGLRDPGVRAVLGGDDPYSFDFDEVEYKVRHDFDFKVNEWRGAFGSIVAGG